MAGPFLPMMLVDMRAWLTAREETVGPSRGGGRHRHYHVNASLRRCLGRLLRLPGPLFLPPRMACGCWPPLPKARGDGNAWRCSGMSRGQGGSNAIGLRRRRLPSLVCSGRCRRASRSLRRDHSPCREQADHAGRAADASPQDDRRRDAAWAGAPCPCRLPAGRRNAGRARWRFERVRPRPGARIGSRSGLISAARNGRPDLAFICRPPRLLLGCAERCSAPRPRGCLTGGGARWETG
jgi:hypothetical protein